MLTRDDFGRVATVLLPDGELASYGRDQNGNMTTVVPPGQPEHVLNYTPVDLLESHSAPATAGGPAALVSSFTYTLDRNLSTITRADGEYVMFGYRPDGKRDTVTTTRGVRQYGYHPTTRLVSSISDGNGGTVSFSYNGSRLTTTNWSGTGRVQGSVGVTLNQNLWPSSVSVNGAPVSYTYDNDGFVTAAGSMSITRSPASGDITGTTLGSVTTTEAVNTFGELDGYLCRTGSTDLYSEQVTQRDAQGRIAQRTEVIEGVSHVYGYGYDGAGRLIDVTKDGAALSHYDYDDNGNRLGHTTALGTTNGAYDDRDQLTDYGTRQYTYSDAGSLETVTDTATSELTSFDYDIMGNLRAASLPDGRTIEYEIDALNRRVGKKIDGVVQQRFLYRDRLDPVALLDGNNAVVATFVYGTRQHVPDFMFRGGQTYRLVSDQLGSVRLVVNVSTGAVAQRIDYDEWGVATLMTGTWDFQPFGFAGGLHDPDTGLVRFGSRDYDPRIGRWTCTDPILFANGQTNLYLYASGDPINRIDPTGLDDSDLDDLMTGGEDNGEDFDELIDCLADGTCVDGPTVPGPSDLFDPVPPIPKPPGPCTGSA